MLILYEKSLSHLKFDEFGYPAMLGIYTYTVKVRLVLNTNGRPCWGIDTGDFAMWEQGLFSLPKLVCRAMHEAHDNNPKYYRLKERMENMGVWRSL